MILNVKYWSLLIDSLKPCCELESTREASCPPEPWSLTHTSLVVLLGETRFELTLPFISGFTLVHFLYPGCRPVSGNTPVMVAASFTERRDDLRGGFMLCFLDDGAGMDPSKWLWWLFLFQNITIYCQSCFSVTSLLWLDDPPREWEAIATSQALLHCVFAGSCLNIGGV